MDRSKNQQDVYNGLLFNSVYLPREMVLKILLSVDLKTLIKCQLVCKRWKKLIWTDVWPMKVSMIHGQPFPSQVDTPRTYYLICEKKPFLRNLVKNHSGVEKLKHWKVIHSQGDNWAVESPPSGVPSLPIGDEPVFEGKESCFVTSYGKCTKLQYIDLVKEGLSPYVLDKLKPPITVSEWYSCRWDCRAYYQCSIKLLGAKGKAIKSFEFKKILEGADQNQWFKVSHEFNDYGPGVRKIIFQHTGVDRQFWAGHYGSKMAGACVLFKLPISKTKDVDSSSSSTDSE